MGISLETLSEHSLAALLNLNQLNIAHFSLKVLTLDTRLGNLCKTSKEKKNTRTRKSSPIASTWMASWKF